MTTYRVDSWGRMQMEKLHEFFRTQAKPGDTIIFDRVLAQDNGRPGEALDDNGCNDWVFSAANQALNGSGLAQDIVQAITLKTEYLHHAYPQKIVPGAGAPVAGSKQPEAETEVDLWEDEEVLADEKGSDKEAEDWAAAVAKYHKRNEPA